jgi:hypothetical protein
VFVAAPELLALAAGLRWPPGTRRQLPTCAAGNNGATASQLYLLATSTHRSSLRPLITLTRGSGKRLDPQSPGSQRGAKLAYRVRQCGLTTLCNHWCQGGHTISKHAAPAPSSWDRQLRTMWDKLVRPRYAVLLVLGLAAVLGWHVRTSPPSQEARVVVLFLAPSSPSAPNQYRLFRPDLAATADVVVRTVTDSPIRQQIESAGLLPSYDVIITNTGTQEEPQYAEPTLTVTAVSTNPSRALLTASRVTSLLERELYDRQRVMGADEDFLIVSRRIGAPVVRPIEGQPNRALAAIGLLGVGSAAFVGLLTDRLRNRISAAPRSLPRPAARGSSVAHHVTVTRSQPLPAGSQPSSPPRASPW